MAAVELNQMTRSELEQTAQDLGVSFRQSITDAKLKERIERHLGEGPVATHPSPSGTKTASRCEIIIATDGADRQPVYVAVNGHNYIIRRGEKVIVPKAVVGVLQDAVQYQYDPETMARQEVLAYPFQITRWIED